MTERLLLEEVFRKQQEVNSRTILGNFIQLHPDFDPGLLTEELMEAGVLSWLAQKRLAETMKCFHCFFRNKLTKRQQIFIHEVSKSKYVGLQKLIQILDTDQSYGDFVTPKNSAQTLRDLLDLTLKLHCGEILKKFLQSPAGQLFDPRIFAEDLREFLAPSLRNDLKTDISRNSRAEKFLHGFSISGLKGVAALLESMRRREMAFEAIYLHLILRKGPVKEIKTNKVSAMAREAHMANDLWTEEYESLQRIKERIAVQKSRRLLPAVMLHPIANSLYNKI